MEVIVDLCDLSQVFVLHLSSGNTLLASLDWIWEANLVYHNIVNVYLLLSKLNCEALSLIHGQKLRNTNSNECSLASIFELGTHCFNSRFHCLHRLEKLLLKTLSTSLSHHAADLVEHATEFVVKFQQFMETFFKDCREVQ